MLPICPVSNESAGLCGNAAMTTDPRVVRTRQTLSAGLRTLMSTHRWDKIRVQDILDLTGVSRSAFYAHFNSKYDLLISGIPETMLPLMAEDGTPDVLPFFEHVDEVSDIMAPLMTQPVLREIVDEFHRQLVVMWSELLVGSAHEGDWVLPEMLAASLLATARAQVSRKVRHEPADVAAAFQGHLETLLGENSKS